MFPTRLIRTFVFRFFSLIIRINPRKILVIPKSTSVLYANCCFSDNVLCILNGLLDKSESSHFVFNYIPSTQYPSRIDGLFASAYAIPYFTGRIRKFVRTISIVYAYLSSKYILSSSSLEPLPFKRSRQLHIVANYFNPFKSDLSDYDIIHPTADYVFTTSLISAHIDSSSSSISVKNYIVTGFPRNDYLIAPRFSRSDLLKNLGLNLDFKQIIVFAPTHRNSSYSNLDGVNFSSLIEALLPAIERNNSAFVIADHPAAGSDLNILSDSYKSHDCVILLSNHQSVSIYDVLAHADLLISDYSSVYFDFLLLERPVVFFFPDFSQYNSARSFSYDPIENVCAGPICYNDTQLVESVELFFDDPSEFKKFYSEKIIWMRKLVNKHCDSSSLRRVLSFLLEHVFT